MGQLVHVPKGVVHDAQPRSSTLGNLPRGGSGWSTLDDQFHRRRGSPALTGPR
jgi:hypothetical protein